MTSRAPPPPETTLAWTSPPETPVVDGPRSAVRLQPGSAVPMVRRTPSRSRRLATMAANIVRAQFASIAGRRRPDTVVVRRRPGGSPAAPRLPSRRFAGPPHQGRPPGGGLPALHLAGTPGSGIPRRRLYVDSGGVGGMIHALLVLAVIVFILWLLFHAAGAVIQLLWIVILAAVILWAIGFLRRRSGI